MAINTTYLEEIRDNVKDKIESDFLYFSTGDDDTEDDPTDTTLGNEQYRAAVSFADKSSFPDEITVSGEIPSTANNGNDINEFGWSKSGSTDDDLEQREALTQGFTKTSDIIVLVESTFDIEVTEE